MRLGLLLLIGLPGSGKTTLAKSIKTMFEDAELHDYYFIHICFDELISFQDQSLECDWKLSRMNVAAKIENLVIAMKTKDNKLLPSEFEKELKSVDKLKSNTVIILDDNMYFKSMRYSFFQMAKKHNISFCQVFLNCSLENALLNNSLRSAECVVPTHIIKNMFLKMEPPNDENYWERFSVLIDAFCDTNKIFHKLFSVLNESLNHYEFSQIPEQKDLNSFCNTNVLHQSDLALRKIIALKIKEFLQQNKDKRVKDFSAELCKKKIEILNDVKLGIIHLPLNIITDIKQGKLKESELIDFLNSYL